MSRNATALLLATPLPDLAGGADLLVIETLLAHPDPSEAGSHEEEHGLCVLVLVGADDDARRLLQSEAARYVSACARVESLIGPHWGDQLVALLHAIEPAFLDLVVGCSPLGRDAWRQVTAVVTSLKTAGRHQLSTGTVVVEQPMPGIEDAHGLRFVAVEGMNAQAGAVWLHTALAQLSAPGMVDCVASEAVADAFGSPAQPARMYLTDADRLAKLTPAIRSPADPGASARAAIFFLDGVGLREYSSATRTLRAAGMDVPVVVAPAGLTLAGAPGSAARCVLVVSASDDPITIRAGDDQ